MDGTALDICSNALMSIGEKAITSFKQGTVPAVLARQLYEPCVQAMLGKHRWSFAKTTLQLSRLTGTPEGGSWDAAYEVPADLLVIHRVEIGGLPIRYERYRNVIRCNASLEEAVIMTYARRVPEAEFPPFFRDALELELAARFAFPITAQESLAATKRREARDAWASARTAGAQEQTAQRFTLNRFKAARRGRG